MPTLKHSPQRLLKHYEQIISKSRDPMMLVDKNYVYLAVNEAHCKVHAKKHRDVIGKSVADILGEEVFHSQVKEFLDRCLAGEKIFYKDWFEFQGCGRRFMEVKCFPVSDEKEQISGVAVFLHDITNREKLANELNHRALELNEVNKALETLLDQSTRALVDMENRIYDNLQQLIFPYIEQLEKKLEAKEELLYLNVIKANLEKISSSFSLTISSKMGGLTHRELQVAQLIKQGKTTKEISLILHISPRTVEFYRDKLRQKLGLKSKRINLRGYLATL